MAEDAKWKKFSRRWEKKAREYKQKKEELESKFNTINQENENLKRELISTREERDRVKESFKEVEKKSGFSTIAIAIILILEFFCKFCCRIGITLQFKSNSDFG